MVDLLVVEGWTGGVAVQAPRSGNCFRVLQHAWLRVGLQAAGFVNYVASQALRFSDLLEDLTDPNGGKERRYLAAARWLTGPAMVATSLSVAAWLTMVLLAVGKLDGR